MDGTPGPVRMLFLAGSLRSVLDGTRVNYAASEELASEFGSRGCPTMNGADERVAIFLKTYGAVYRGTIDRRTSKKKKTRTHIHNLETRATCVG